MVPFATGVPPAAKNTVPPISACPFNTPEQMVFVPDVSQSTTSLPIVVVIFSKAGSEGTLVSLAWTTWPAKTRTLPFPCRLAADTSTSLGWAKGDGSCQTSTPGVPLDKLAG